MYDATTKVGGRESKGFLPQSYGTSQQSDILVPIDFSDTYANTHGYFIRQHNSLNIDFRQKVHGTKKIF